ncbi:DUF4013 domain-containing protein [Halosolutus gelatinilyticus]|uniref:DUF4013 domain-containing protein n=1 Tax=Halosolutus gelatinilyticus TaxID=2931975 RepID=UPI001FF43F9E|nr:DUF4013 domain-containing protein [Halosolutus gelatinilyticus]
MIEDSIRYPVQGSWAKRIGIGGVLAVLSIFLLPAFLLAGYNVRVMRESIAGSDTPPKFDRLGDMFVDGLKAAVIGIAYAIVPTVVWLVAVSGLVRLGSLGGDGAAAVSVIGVLLMVLLMIPLMLLIGYLIPAAMANFAKEDSIGAAFDFGTLKPVYLGGDYVIAVVVAVGVSIALNVVTTILSITIVGLVLVPFLLFYGAMVSSRLYAAGFAKSLDHPSSESVPSAPAVQ